MIIKISKLKSKFNHSMYVCNFWPLKTNKHKEPRTSSMGHIKHLLNMVTFTILWTHEKSVVTITFNCWGSTQHFMFPVPGRVTTTLSLSFSMTSAGYALPSPLHNPLYLNSVVSFILPFFDSQGVPDKTTSKELPWFSTYLTVCQSFIQPDFLTGPWKVL